MGGDGWTGFWLGGTAWTGLGRAEVSGTASRWVWLHVKDQRQRAIERVELGDEVESLGWESHRLCSPGNGEPLGSFVQRNNNNQIYAPELTGTTIYTTGETKPWSGAMTAAHVIWRGWMTATSIHLSVVQQIFVVSPSGKRMVGNKTL